MLTIGRITKDPFLKNNNQLFVQIGTPNKKYRSMKMAVQEFSVASIVMDGKNWNTMFQITKKSSVIIMNAIEDKFAVFSI